jgi:hypothetical protein
VVARGPASQPSFEEGLRQIGLEAEWVRAAVGDGNRERTRVLHSQNAMSAQGYYAWNGILASLTLTVQAFGWVRDDPRSLPILIERNKKNILLISSGDEYTGVTGTGRTPRSRNPKGAVVAALAQQNKKLLGDEPTLFPLDAKTSAEHEFMQELLGCTTYVLLVHFSKRDLEARYEVSRLNDLSASGYLSAQHPRWIAPAYPLTAEDFDPNDPNEGFDGPGNYPVPPKR